MTSDFADIDVHEAQWLQPHSSERRFDLVAEGATLARLTFRSRWGSFALAETAAGRWTYKRVGFMNPRVTVRVEGGTEDIGVYEPRWAGDGVLRLKGERTIRWKPEGFWRRTWTFVEGEDRVLLRFSPGVEGQGFKDMLKTQLTLEIEQPGRGHAALPILATLGLYLLILHNDDAAAGAAVVASIG
jgi:hypothetical protein